jgi:hypothetical protein
MFQRLGDNMSKAQNLGKLALVAYVEMDGIFGPVVENL